STDAQRRELAKAITAPIFDRGLHSHPSSCWRGFKRHSFSAEISRPRASTTCYGADKTVRQTLHWGYRPTGAPGYVDRLTI
ncbi:hypothetical protein, partial [Salmonella sp. SAL4355]|uniref:hypothetical protein n=1 Tax=Salmonella sp. SAL4355 TaxID=3159876 RepID=UPI00397B7823